MAATTQTSERVAPAATDSLTPRAPRYAGLDGLRAIAVLTVMLFHLTPGLLPGGFLGVDIFFVISGFLITSLLLTEHANTGVIRLREFWRRRARRLLPALGVLILVCCGAAATGSRSPLTAATSMERLRSSSATCGRWRWRSSSTWSGRWSCCCSCSPAGAG
jgi:peptidoglycan/LPS O-acetylase OafA/YrhL